MIPRPYIEIFVLVLAGILAVYAGSHLVQLSLPALAEVTSLVLVLIWILTARDYWWTPVLTGATVTGLFWIGFKIYPLEATVVLCVLALVPMFLLRGERMYQSHRRPLPLLFYLAALYITIRMAVDIIPAQGARGNLGRIYFEAIWPFFFGWLFYRYGKTSVVWAALIFAFIMLTFRAGAATIGYIYDIPLYIPGINYILSFSEADSFTAMRFVAYNLLFISLIFFHAFRSWFAKFSLTPIIAFTSGLIVLGQGRFMTLMYIILPICFFAWSRRWYLFLFALLAGGGVFLAVNLNPHLIDKLPENVARSLSGIIIFKQEATETQVAAESSNEWHSALREEGYERWTQSPLTYLFGYGLRPSPDLFETKQYSLDPKAVVGIAANVGAYECGLWSVLALLGLAGGLLYLLFFLQLWKRLLPYFLNRPRNTVWEGLVFWGVYGSFLWFVTCYFQGKFPDLEVFLAVLACAIVEDGRVPLEKPEAEGEEDVLLDLEKEPAGWPLHRP
jgi:hypothetical protein